MKFAVVAFIASALSVANADVFIRVRPHVVVTPNSDVMLAQLVHAEGLSRTGTEKMRDTAMSKAPAYGERQELAPASLMEVLRPIVQSERMISKVPVHLVMSKSVIVDTLKRDITADGVSAELLQAWQPLCTDCKLEVEGLSLPAVQGVRDWTLKVKAELPRGSFSIPMDIIRMDRSPVSAWVSGRILVKRKAPVAKRALAPGERVQAADFAIEYRDTSFSTDGIPQDGEIVGRRLRSGARAGDILWASQLEKEKAVRRGETVQVKSSEGMWEVSMTVVAQQDAVIGDIINLKNPKTNNILVGQVTGLGEVELR